MNPIDMLKMIKNPKEFVINYAKQNTNPMLNNLIDMANNNNANGIENFARNLMKQQGRDFDKEIKEFQDLIK